MLLITFVNSKKRMRKPMKNNSNDTSTLELVLMTLKEFMLVSTRPFALILPRNVMVLNVDTSKLVKRPRMPKPPSPRSTSDPPRSLLLSARAA